MLTPFSATGIVPCIVTSPPASIQVPFREKLLQRLLRRLERSFGHGRTASDRFTRWRLFVFGAGLIVCIMLYRLGWYQTGNSALLLFLALFTTVAWYHNRLEDRMHRLRRWKALKSAHLARFQLDWQNIPPRAWSDVEHHPYARDLDLLGPHSLLHLIDTTVSTQGRERLTSWFLSQSSPPRSWGARQALIRELAPLSLLRDRIALEATLVDQQEIDGARLLAVLHSPVGYSGLTMLLLIETALAGMTLVLLIGNLMNWLPSYWMLPFALYAFIYLLVRGRTKDVFDHAVALHHHLEKVAAVFTRLERMSMHHTPALSELCTPLRRDALKPSHSLKQAAGLLARLSIKAHPLVHYALNAIGPWDLYYTFRLQELQQRISQSVPAWFEIFAEFEASSALANFAYLHPDYSWPTLTSPDKPSSHNGVPATFTADRLAHPLIPRIARVANDLHLEGSGHIVLVTGSNMSGKSTFLRTVGVNLCLAQTGAPVCAEQFEWAWARPACCIRVDDSLETGLSFFYAEVKRLKSILTAVGRPDLPPVLFLIDEVFRGTNNRERLLGARAFIEALAKSRGFGLITTHDLELTDLTRQIPTLQNMHFQETVHNGMLQFDYRLRPGPCPTTNALRIMALEGLPVPAQNP